MPRLKLQFLRSVNGENYKVKTVRDHQDVSRGEKKSWFFFTRTGTLKTVLMYVNLKLVKLEIACADLGNLKRILTRMDADDEYMKRLSIITYGNNWKHWCEQVNVYIISIITKSFNRVFSIRFL